ncbi:MAG: DUF4401 domain-containing protein [Pseudomonas sp.]
MTGLRLKGWLDELEQQALIDAPLREKLVAGVDSPWWLALLLGIAAWVSALFIIGSFMGPWLLFVEGSLGRSLAGAALLGFGIWLFSHPGVFVAQLALALSLAGQGLLVYVLGSSLDASSFPSLRSAALVCLPLSALLLWLPVSRLFRQVSAFFALASIAVLLESGPQLALLASGLALVAAWGWLQRPAWAAHPLAARLRPLLDAATFMALVLAAYGEREWLVRLLDSGVMTGNATALLTAARVVPVLLLLAIVAWLARHADLLQRSFALVAAALLGLLFYQAPGLLISCALGLAVCHAQARSWMLLVLVFAAFYLGHFYYSLHITLLHKSMLLVGSGVLLLVVRYGLIRYGRGK